MDQTTKSPKDLTITFHDGSSTKLQIFPATDADAEVVLCLPAMGVTSSYYEVLADALVDSGFTTVLADLRGSGGSSVRADRSVSFGYTEILDMELPAITEAICQELKVEQVTVLGHSLGGQMALLFAASSTRVSRTVAIACGSAWYRKVPGRGAATRFLGLQLMFATTLLWGYLPTWFPFAGREARGVMVDWGYEAMTGRYRVSRSAVNYEDALARSTVPALVIDFPGDGFVPGSCSEHLASKLRSARVVRQEIPPQRFGLKETHHFRWAMRPQAVVDAVKSWTRQQADSPTGGRAQ
jgi:predicted alpha/beta hydrolase